MQKLAPQTYAALRIVAGLLFAFHGVQKLTGAFGGHEVALASQLGVGAVIELVGGLAIALGLFTRIAAFICSGQMAVAYFQFHWKLQHGDAFFPAVNGGELAVLYCFLFLCVAAAGPGVLALDNLRKSSPAS